MIFMFIMSSAYAEDLKVIPIGKAVGIQLYTDGLLVIGTSEVNGHDAAKESDIRVNDLIKSINGVPAGTSEEFAKAVNSNPDGLELEIARDNQKLMVNAVPVLCEDEVYRLGLWVRDSCAGVGTVTYYNPADKSFAALGHAINDIDTGNILSAKSGNILDCDILSVTKSKRGSPGEINASFSAEKIGEIALNSPYGLFGDASGGYFNNYGESIPVAAKEQVHTGDAVILSDIFGKSVTEYSVKINKITNDDDKGLVIEITDERLIENTGGIIQGMSGSPIIQDGCLVGAVTHVFVNSPLKGYGTLAEKMLDAQRNKTALQS